MHQRITAILTFSRTSTTTMARRSLRLSVAASSSASIKTESSQSSTPVPTTARRPKPRAAEATAARKPIQKASSSDSSAASSIPILPFATPAAFQEYVVAQGPTSPGVWLKIGKKSNPVPSVTYDQALDVSLCCGWIDGQRRPFDEAYFLQRFTPRRKASLWSKRNVDKVAVLTAAGKMMPEGQVQVDAAKADGRWDRAYAGASNAEVPADFRAALDKVPAAAKVFDGLTKAARYPFLYRLATTKKAETREKKMAMFVDMLARGETL